VFADNTIDQLDGWLSKGSKDMRKFDHYYSKQSPGFRGKNQLVFNLLHDLFGYELKDDGKDLPEMLHSIL
jgi:hypothetical protein